MPSQEIQGKLLLYYPLNQAETDIQDRSGNAMMAKSHTKGNGFNYQNTHPIAGTYGSITLSQNDAEAFSGSIQFGHNSQNYSYYQLEAHASQTVATWLKLSTTETPRLEGTLSLSAWVKLHTLDGRQTIFSSGSPQKSDGWWFGIHQGKLTFGTRNLDSIQGQHDSLKTEQWYHFAFTINDSTVTLFINGNALSHTESNTFNFKDENTGSLAFIGIDPSLKYPLFANIAQLKIDNEVLNESSAQNALAKPGFWRKIQPPFWGDGSIAMWYDYRQSNWHNGASVGVEEWISLCASGYPILYEENFGILPDGSGIMYGQVENHIAPPLSGILTIYAQEQEPLDDYNSHSTFIARVLHGQARLEHPSRYNFPLGDIIASARGTVSYTTHQFREHVLKTQWHGRLNDELPNFETPEHRFKILNISNSMGNGEQAYTPALDYFIKEKDIIAVTAQPGSLAENATCSGNLWNSIVVGKNTNDYGYYVGAIYNNIKANQTRPKPDITSYNGSSSFACPTIASGAAMLCSLAESRPTLLNAGGDRSVVIKALLMAGAIKRHLSANYTDDLIPINPTLDNYAKHEWSNRPEAPLDLHYGAGFFNIANAYWILESGSFNPYINSTPPNNPQEKATAWSRQHINGNGSHYYFFKLPKSQVGTPHSSLLNWHRSVTPSTDGKTFLYDSLETMRMELWDYQDINKPILITHSDDPTNNIEHIYLKDGLSKAGLYCLIIHYTNAKNTEYALAFRNGYHPITQQKEHYTINYRSIPEMTLFQSNNPLNELNILKEDPHLGNLLTLIADGLVPDAIDFLEKTRSPNMDFLNINQKHRLDGEFPLLIQEGTKRSDFEIIDRCTGKTATVTLNFHQENTAYKNWLAQYPEMTQTAASDDPDNDQMINAEEFFLNSDPTENNMSHLQNDPVIGLHLKHESNSLDLNLITRFSQLPSNFHLENSSDLINWAPYTQSPSIQPNQNGTYHFQWNHFDAYPQENHGKNENESDPNPNTQQNFIRLKLKW